MVFNSRERIPPKFKIRKIIWQATIQKSGKYKIVMQQNL